MAKPLDLTGQRFGSWTAQYYLGHSYWHCICDCGTEKDIYTSNLRSGKTKSCGCQKNNLIKEKIKKDIVGQTFGELTVLRATEERQCGAIVWECQCSCGNICKVATGNLTSGHTASCGCKKKLSIPRLDSLAGQRFGKLIALERVYDLTKTRSRRVGWKCQCDCGNIITVPQDCLTRKDFTQSCGCLKSKGEETIIKLLQDNNISFEYQKTFDNCIFNNGKKPIFDFFINNQYIVEYDGIQHFEIHGWNNEEKYNKIIQRDEFKNQWCKEHNIPLIRIPYTHLDNLVLDDLLLERSLYIWQHCDEVKQQKKL